MDRFSSKAAAEPSQTRTPPLKTETTLVATGIAVDRCRMPNVRQTPRSAKPMRPRALALGGTIAIALGALAPLGCEDDVASVPDVGFTGPPSLKILSPKDGACIEATMGESSFVPI